MSMLCDPSIAAYAQRHTAATTVVPDPTDQPHANTAVQADPLSTVPMQLLRGWAAAGQECIVVDIDGRHAPIDAGREKLLTMSPAWSQRSCTRC